MLRPALLGIIACSTLIACGPTEETHTVNWYMENDSERQLKLKDCAENPGDIRKTPNCQNADQAALKAMSGPSKVDYSKVFQ